MKWLQKYRLIDYVKKVSSVANQHASSLVAASRSADQDEDKDEDKENGHDNEDPWAQKKPPVVWSVNVKRMHHNNN